MSRLSKERSATAGNEPELTPKQVEVLAAVERITKFQGYPPSFQHLADDLGMTKSTVHGHLHRLAEKGIIELGDGPRTLRVLKPLNPPVAVLVITPERAWKWLTGEDQGLEEQLRNMAYAHEESLRADPRPVCGLCAGTGRIGDDIFCLRCGGEGRVST